MLESCCGLAQLRTRLFGRNDLTLKDLLADDSVYIMKVMQFIEKVGFAAIYQPIPYMIYLHLSF